jgi:hypothetical protein
VTAPVVAPRPLTAGGGRVGPLPTRQRRPAFMAIGAAVVLAAVGAWLYDQAGAKTPVVVVVADVPAGHVVERSDVSTVDVAGAITAVAGGHLEAVVGQTAAVHLLPNTLLQRSIRLRSAQVGSDQCVCLVGDPVSGAGGDGHQDPILQPGQPDSRGLQAHGQPEVVVARVDGRPGEQGLDDAGRP